MTYAIFSLGSMAMMSLSIGFFIAMLIWEYQGPAPLLSDLHKLYKDHDFIRWYFWVSVFFVAMCFISLAGLIIFPVEFNHETVTIHWVKDLGKNWYFILPPLFGVAWLRLSEIQRKTVLRAWFLSFGVLSIVGIFQIFTGWPRAQTNPLLPGFFHTTLLFGHHLSTANIFIFPFFAILDSLIQKKPILSKPILWSFFILGLVVLFFTYSRTLWVALPLGFIFWAFLRLPARASIVSSVVVLTSTVALTKLPIVQTRIQNLMGVHTRFAIWKANFDFFRLRPFTGIGFGKNHDLYTLYFREKNPSIQDFFTGHAHNIYLENLAGLGVLGSIAWFLWMGVIFKCLFYCLKSTRDEILSRGLLSAWIVFLINGLTQVNFWEAKVLHQIMWITGIILFQAITVSNEIMPEKSAYTLINKSRSLKVLQ